MIGIKNGIPTLTFQHEGEFKGYDIIDVRRADEFNGELGHIEGARLLTLGPELDHFLNQENKSKKIIFVCRSSARSGKATAQALELGFQNVLNLDGGMILWNELGLPTSR